MATTEDIERKLLDDNLHIARYCLRRNEDPSTFFALAEIHRLTYLFFEDVIQKDPDEILSSYRDNLGEPNIFIGHSSVIVETIRRLATDKDYRNRLLDMYARDLSERLTGTDLCLVVHKHIDN